MWVAAVLVLSVAHIVRRFKKRAEEDDDSAPSRAVAWVLLLAALVVALAQTIVVGVLADLAREFGTDAVGATWMLTAFMLASAVATPIAGRLGDQHGHRRVIVAGLALLAIGSVLTAVSVGAGWYSGALLGRVVQGFAGGVFPCTFGLARQVLPSQRLPRVIAALSAMFGVGGAAGMVVAGPLADVAGTSAVFWTIAGLSVIALAGSSALPRHQAGTTQSRGFDITGGVLLAATLVSLLLAISQARSWGAASPATVGLGIAVLVFAGAFGAVEHRTAEPLIDLRLFFGRRLIALNVATVVTGLGMFAAVTLLPLLAQAPPQSGYGFGYSAARTGLLIAPIGVCMTVAAPVTSRLAGQKKVHVACSRPARRSLRSGC